MIRFIETIKFNPVFAKAVYDSDRDRLDFYGRRRNTKFDRWPKCLDMENFEIDYIVPDSLVFLSGGDWQETVPVTLRLKKDSHNLIWIPFDAYTSKSADEIKIGCRDLINWVKNNKHRTTHTSENGII
jgi:hypothetical protein